jgi:hypothetical protein
MAAGLDRPDDEVELHLPLVAVVRQVDARIDVAVGDPAVMGHVGLPLARIAPLEIVAGARQRIEPYALSRRVGAGQLQAQHRSCRLGADRLLQDHRCPRPGQEQVVALAARKELDR